jgi:hypothetical protein
MGSQPQKAAAMARVRPIQPKARWTYANPARANFLCAKRLEYVSAYSDLAHNVRQSSAWLSSSLISKPGEHPSTADAHWTALARKPLTNHSVARAADILMSAMQIHHTPDAMVVDSLMRFTLHAVLYRWPPSLIDKLSITRIFPAALVAILIALRRSQSLVTKPVNTTLPFLTDTVTCAS